MSAPAGKPALAHAARPAIEVLRGRAEQMTAALRALRAIARGGHAQVLIVTGEPGMGKSALARAILAEAAVMRFRIGSASADAAGQLSPAAPLLLALRLGSEPLLSSAELLDLAAQVEEPLVLLEAIGDRLETAAKAGPVLVALDDLDRTDQLTRFLLRALPFRLARLPVLWLLSGRAGQGGVLSDLSNISGSRAGQVPIHRIELPPLSHDAVLDIARDRLAGAADDAADLLAWADGNPLLALQIIDGLGALNRGAGPAAGLAVPRQVARALHSTLAGVGPLAADLVRVLAVFGQPASSRDVEGLICAPAPDSAAILDEAIRAGVLDRRDGKVDFRYRLVREAVHSDLEDAARHALHRRCAAYLAAAGAATSLIAEHAREGIEPGQAECAAISMRAAGALAAASPRAAGELALTAFRALRPTDPPYLELGEQCVRILGLVQRCDDALDVGNLVLAHFDDGESAGRVELALARALWLAARWPESSVRCTSVLARTDLTPGMRARLTALRALVESRTLGAAAMRPRAEEALAEARRLDDRDGKVTALHALAEITRNGADHAASLAYWRLLRAENQPLFFAQEIMALQHLDRYRDAEALLKQAWSESAGRPASALPAVQYAQIWQDFNLGRLDEAKDGAKALMDLGRELGSRMCELEAASIASMVALYRGQLDEARRELALDGNGPTADDEAHAPPLLLTRGWLTAASGEPDTAVRMLAPLVHEAREERDAWPWKPGWLPVLATIGIADDDAGFLSEVLVLAETGAARNPGVATFEGIALHVKGIIERDVIALQRAVGILDPGPRPLLATWARESLGSQLLAEGHRDDGITHLGLAWESYHRAGAVGPMLRVQHVLRKAGVRRANWARTQPAPASGWEALTLAERTVARLMGTGYSNREIAAELRVSPNTIGTHGRSIFAKLGVRSRAQLSNEYHLQVTGE